MLERLPCACAERGIVRLLSQAQQFAGGANRDVQRGVARMSHRFDEGAGHHEIILGVVPSVGIKGERAVRLLQRQQLAPPVQERFACGSHAILIRRLLAAPRDFRLQLLGQRCTRVLLKVTVQERRRMRADLVRLRNAETSSFVPQVRVVRLRDLVQCLVQRPAGCRRLGQSVTFHVVHDHLQTVPLAQPDLRIEFDALFILQLQGRFRINLVLVRLAGRVRHHEAQQVVVEAIDEVRASEHRLRDMTAKVEPARRDLVRVPRQANSDSVVADRHERNGDFIRMWHGAHRPRVFEPVGATRPLVADYPLDSGKDRIVFAAPNDPSPTRSQGPRM